MSKDDLPGRVAGPEDAWTVIAYLLTGLVLWGGAGLLLDRWLGTEFFVLLGMLIGGASSLYLVYIRYGQS